MRREPVPRRPGGEYRVMDYATEKKCTRCKDWWPADDEFFPPRQLVGNRTTLGSWCRCCVLEASKETPLKTKRRIARIATVIALASASAAHAGDFCTEVENLAYTIQVGKDDGMTRQQQLDALKFTIDPVGGQVGEALVEYIYTANDDNSMPAGRVAQLAKSACRTTEPNALNQGMKP